MLKTLLLVLTMPLLSGCVYLLALAEMEPVHDPITFHLTRLTPGHDALEAQVGRFDSMYIEPQALVATQDIDSVYRVKNTQGDEKLSIILKQSALDKLAEAVKHQDEKKVAILRGNRVIKTMVIKDRMKFPYVIEIPKTTS